MVLDHSIILNDISSFMKIIKEISKNLKTETERRIKKMQEEFRKEPEIRVFENTEKYDQIIMQSGIEFSSLCEHHHVGFSGKVSIGYVPGEWLIGLSKLGRIVEYHLNPILPTIQERATQQILKDMKEALAPKGVIVIIKASHTCIGYRGIKKPSLTITSAVDGIFAYDQSAKLEFLQLINNE